MHKATLYRGSYGLSNRVPPELIPFNAKTGVTGLQRADNVLIGEAGQLYCRQGSRQVYSLASCHSPLQVPGGFLIVREKSDGDYISIARDDQDGDLVFGDIAKLKYRGEWLSWFELNGDYWYSTQRERGIISGALEARSWPDSEQFMQEDSDDHVEPLPHGRHFIWHGIHAIAASGRYIYISEPNQPSLYRSFTGTIRVAGPVKLLQPVQTGFFYSDDSSIWFIGGKNPESFVKTRVYGHPAIEYCKVHRLVSGSELYIDSYALGAVFMTTAGPVFGFSDGTIINLTDKQFSMPECKFSRGSMMIPRQNKSTLIISLN